MTNLKFQSFARFVLENWISVFVGFEVCYGSNQNDISKRVKLKEKDKGGVRHKGTSSLPLYQTLGSLGDCYTPCPRAWCVITTFLQG